MTSPNKSIQNIKLKSNRWGMCRVQTRGSYAIAKLLNKISDNNDLF
jgi:hypothetical protein